jgi:indolepyruvate ferredoxin oxidoreductase, beta subunit
MQTSQQPMSDSIAASSPVARAITIAILAMGGEGGGVLADWIVDLAENSGYMAQTTSVPGVAQRTGATIYYVELFPEAAARAAGKDPVMALMPVPGEVDVVLASELMEAGRAITRGLVTPDRTTLIASTNRVYSMTEKISMGDGRVDADSFIAAGKAAARVFIPQDFSRIAEQTGSVISAVLFGALAGAGTLPFERKQFEDAIERSGISVASSRKAFAAGLEAAANNTPAASAKASEQKAVAHPAPGPALRTLTVRVSARFPAASQEVLLAGIQRLADYQDVAYATEYLDRLDPVRDIDEKHGDSTSANGCPLLCETGRHLALWMSYEDAIRVADLKTRRTRFERVQAETHVSSSQLLRINEFLHPRVEEFADILPAPLGRWLLKSGWASRTVGWLTRNGKILQTTSLTGFMQLYIIASLRGWRRMTLRFKRESQRINDWLRQVQDVAASDYELALELAACPHLIKGYGDTYVLGSGNFDALMRIVPVLRQKENAAARLRSLREAALADDTGKRLADALRELS